MRVVHEDHVFIYHEKAVNGSQFHAGRYDGLGVSEGLIVRVELFEVGEGRFEEGFGEDRNIGMFVMLDEESGSAGDGVLVSLQKEEQFFFGLELQRVAECKRVLHIK